MQEVLNFILVLACAMGIAGGLSALYANGLRLLMTSEGTASTGRKIGSYICFGACILVIVFALWLIIPIFHK